MKQSRPIILFSSLIAIFMFGLISLLFKPAPSTFSVDVKIDPTLHDKPLDGRVILLFSDNDESEPRFQARPGVNAVQMFGKTVNGLKKGEATVFDDKVFGYPMNKLSNVPSGEYYVQVVFHKYETFNLSTGHTVKLPMDRGEGQQWRRAPGNLYSEPVKIYFDSSAGTSISVTLDQVIPDIEVPEDTEFIKHIRIQSKLLTEFWGRPMYLGAHILLPKDFDQYPEARFPLMVFHGHFPSDFGGFSTTPPPADLEPDFSERFKVVGYNRIVQQEAYELYKTWVSDDFPRFLAIEIQHQNPYYDDSYAVNSASMGPYGDAITYELIPHIEKEFRGIGEGWARFLYGGSTGGWEALAAQIFYPDEYNGSFAACPDPIDFREYTQVNIYEDDNAYYEKGAFNKVMRSGNRDWLGNINATVEDYNHFELVLGTNSRSGDQYDIWQAVYSPMGPDGYPQPIWNKRTGKIDRQVANYWKENYDLRHILERDWKELGTKLEGKIHIYTGDMDNYYLNNAVYLMEDFLETTSSPYYGGEVDYGDRAEHCWNGDHDNPNHISRLRYNTMYVPKILKRIENSAPAGADLRSWRY